MSESEEKIDRTEDSSAEELPGGTEPSEAPVSNQPAQEEASQEEAAKEEVVQEEAVQEEAARSRKKRRFAGVRFTDGKVMEFDPQKLDLHVGDMVVVDNERDLNLGRVVFVADNYQGAPLKRVIRRVSPEDLMLIRRNKKREEEAFQLCAKLIEDHRLPMKLIRVAYLHGGNKAIFYFSADGRIDFRALVRDLAQQLHVRIEMRQIGVRDESKMLGGIGICGQHLCCSRFLHKFVPVSIKMAKNQNLALNPQKLSGLCGRLMCCLVYEDKVYRDQRKLLPKHGSIIDTPLGKGKVTDIDIPGCRVRVQTEERTAVFTASELSGETEYKQDEESNARPRRREVRAEASDTTSRDGRRKRRRRPKSPQEGREKSQGTKQSADSGTSKKKEESSEGKEGPADKKKRKRRSRKRARRRKKTAKPEGQSQSRVPKGNGKSS